MSENPTPSLVARPPRRVRYSGRNPRRFEQKYKELRPERYPETLAKVIASGKTPAGTHRPICVPEILEILRPKAGEIAVDATLGFGGHAVEILKRLIPGGTLLGIDTDPLQIPKTTQRLRDLGFGESEFVPIRSNYAALRGILAERSLAGADLILADLGVSSMQLDDPARGFSFKTRGPLDLRMNPLKGRPASALLASASEAELSQWFQENADEPNAALIARAIIERRASRPFHLTTELSQTIEHALRSGGKKPEAKQISTSITRVFQALRIVVNDEFGTLDTFLRFLPHCLRPGGRVAILSFHSGEDRRVKKAFADGLKLGIYSAVAAEVIRPGAEEIRSNPRAGAAKLRWAIKA